MQRDENGGSPDIGVVLTVALDDGTVGLWAVKDRGCLAFAPDPACAIRNRKSIAMNSRGMDAGVMDFGKVTRYPRPDCHDVTIQIQDGPTTRFRCHTGHVIYSNRPSLRSTNPSIQACGTNLRAIEKRMMLLQQTAGLADHSNASAEARSYRKKRTVRNTACSRCGHWCSIRISLALTRLIVPRSRL